MLTNQANEKHTIGLIEAIGLASAIEAADTALKTGNVRLLGYEYSGYDAHIVVKIEGNVGAVQTAVHAACAASENVSGTLHGYEASLTKARMDNTVYDVMLHNEKTVGDELQLRSGKRPQGTNKTAKWVG
ncbi:MAG: BMC domain-containing protein, partial [Lachnospiraceae bacterium]|nr:BMC domain-containing protein [Lachnospiraceae bacterium]